MTFTELRALLVSLGRDPLEVTDTRYDDPETIARAPLDRWRIWAHDGIFDVGSEERGRFVRTHRFGAEEQACDYLAGVFRGSAPQAESEAEKARSEQVSADVNARLNALFDE